MNDLERGKIREIKARVSRMMEERHRLSGQSAGVVKPSDYWTDFCTFFDYVLGMQEDSFEKLRLHTYHLTGDNYLTYYMDTGVTESRFLAAWRNQVKGLPDSHVVFEPEPGIGFRTPGGGLVSVDTSRYQHVINTLHREGVLESVAGKPGRKFVMEIGAGYGGLLHHLAKLLPDTTFVMVDLPETLLFSASYLTLHNPGKKVGVYDPEQPDALKSPEALAQFDFVAIPNYRTDDLNGTGFDLVLNVASLQEMRTEQVVTYLDFVRDNCRGVFYSWNREDANPVNRELEGLTGLLTARFQIDDVGASAPAPRATAKTRLKQVLRRGAVAAGLMERPPSDPAGRKGELLMRPLPKSGAR